MTYANMEYYREYQKKLLIMQMADYQDEASKNLLRDHLRSISDADAPSLEALLKEDAKLFYWDVVHAILCWPEEKWNILGLLVIDDKVPKKYQQAIHWRGTHDPLTWKEVDKHGDAFLPKNF